MKKYNINNFYVGNLVYGLKFGNLFSPKIIPETESKRQELFYIKQKGAISYGDYMMLEYIDWEKRLHYKQVFTIFYRNNDKYYCLHNGKQYLNDENKEDYCDNLIPLTECLPKINSNIPTELSLHEAKNLFNILFKNLNKRIYTKDTLDINKIYLGNLYLCWGLTKKNNSHERFYYCNTPQKLILKSQRNLFKQMGYSKLELLDDKDKIEYDYSGYKSFFLNLEDGKYYNLNDFCFYNIKNINEYDNSIEIKKPFKETLEENDIFIRKDELTIPKILKLQQKINNR